MNRFFPPAEPQQLGTVADAVGATVDPAARERIMSDVMPLDSAGSEHISFMRDAKRRKEMEVTKAGAISWTRALRAACRTGVSRW